MSGGTISTSANKLEALELQSSVRGATIPWVRGVTKLAANLVYFNGFKAIKHTETQGGKGGPSVSNTSYTYRGSLMFGLCHGPIIDVPRVWRGKDVYTGGVTAAQVATTDEAWTVPVSGPMQRTLSQAAGYLATLAVTQASVSEGEPLLLAPGIHYSVSAAGVISMVGESWRGRALTIQYQYRTGTINRVALQKLGFTLNVGHIGQADWSGLAQWPSESIGYSGLAVLAAQAYDLGSNAQIENHNFEVVAPGAWSIGPTIPDCDPAAVLRELLVEDAAGASLPAEYLGSWSSWSDYCVAAGLLVSPCLEQQATAAEVLANAAKLTNAGIVTSSGRIEVVPYADQAEVGNGRTYAPSATPVYDLDDECWVPRSDGAAPLTWQFKDGGGSEAYNHWRLQYRNRDNAYNVEPVEAKDAADIAENGLRTNPTQVDAGSWICAGSAARKAVQLMMQRSISVLLDYKATLPWHYALLEPMDLVTLTDPSLLMERVPARVIEIQENEDGDLDMVAEDAPIGIASSPTYPSPPEIGYSPAHNGTGGPVAEVRVFEGPAQLASPTGLEVYIAARGATEQWGGCQVWISLDGSTYRQIGTINEPSRFGELAASLAAGASSMFVAGLGEEDLNSGSAADAEALQSLCWVGGVAGEFVAHAGATLTAPGAYTLSGLVRAAYGSPDAAHAAGVPFVRIDDRVARSGPLDASMVGKTLYVKLPSFNIFGGGLEALADVTALTYVVNGQPASYMPGVSGKGLVLRASALTIQYPKAGGVNPASIGLTVERKGTLEGAVTWSVVAGTATLTGTGDSRTLAASGLATDAATIRATITDGIGTYQSEVTIVKVREGLDGATGAQGPQGLPGTAGNYTAYIFQRATTQPAAPTGDNPAGWFDEPPSGTNPLWMTKATKTAAGALVGAWSTPARMDGDGISVEYSVDGSTSWHSTFTAGDLYMRQRTGLGAWSAAIKIVGEDGLDGAPGTSPPLLVLLCSAQAFTFAGDGTASPTSQTISFQASMQNLTGTATWTATRYNSFGTSLGAITLGGSGNTRSMTVANFGAAAYAVVTATRSGISDQVSVVRLRDGASNVVADLTNDSHTLPASANGTVTDYSGAATQMKVYVGLVDDSANWTFSRTNSSGVTSSIAGAVVTVTAMTAGVDTGYVDVTATRSGYPTQTKRFVLAKAKSAPGATGVLTNWFASASGEDLTSPYSMSASVTLNADGTISRSQSPNAGSGSTGVNWYGPTTAGAGTGRQVRATKISGADPTTGTLGDWTSIPATWGLTGSDNADTLLAIQVRDSSTGEIQGAGQIALDNANGL